MAEIQALNGILQYCRVTVFDSTLDTFDLESNNAKFQLNPIKNGRDICCLRVCLGGLVLVGSDALPRACPSLIWLSWGFSLAWAVTVSTAIT